MTRIAARQCFRLPYFLKGLCAILALASVGRNAVAADQKPRPDIVFFIADDLSWRDCSIYGGTEFRTRNMERIAHEGITLTHAYVASPSCAPSRAAFLTGLDPIRNGSMFNHQPPKADIKKWPAYLQELGYEVAAIGKVAHYAQVKDYGFDHASHFTYHDDECVNASVEWLENRKSKKPLCLIVGTNWPHVPWPKESDYDPNSLPIPPTFVDTPETREARARYAAAVSNADRDLGIVYDAAKKHLGDDTFFMFSADHGSQFPFGKWNCTDAGLRTPLLAVWPGHITAGTKSDAMVSWIDLLPTVVDVVGGSPPESGTSPGQLSGRSFLPVLRGETQHHRDFVFGTHSGDGRMNEYPMRGVRSAKWRYIRNLAPATEFHSHVNKAEAGDGRSYWDSWVREAKTNLDAAAVVHRYHHRAPEELYDVENDPWQLNNLVNDPSHASALAEHREALDDWMKTNGDEGLKSEREFKPEPKPASDKKPAGKQGAGGKKPAQREPAPKE